LRWKREETINIRGIDFPRGLLDAQRDGKLVVFAGAGVSKELPANYPDFEGLVDEIAKGTTHKREKHEPFDHFLGRLHHKGVRVHELAKSLLTDPKSSPNPLHEYLVRLTSKYALHQRCLSGTTGRDWFTSTDQLTVLPNVLCLPMAISGALT
jgi:hypothetical protein